MKRELTLTLLFSLFLVTCTPPMYIPNALNVPVLEEKGDAEIAYNLGTGGHNIQANYAWSNNFGVMVNGSYLKSKTVYLNFDEQINHKFIESGIGYQKHVNDFYYNIYGGYGKGEAHVRGDFFGLLLHPFPHTEAFAQYSKVFIQPSVFMGGSKIEDILKPYLSLRMSYINIDQFDFFVDEPSLSQDELKKYQDFINRSHSNLFFEPSATLKIGTDNIMMMLQIGYSFGALADVKTIFRHRDTNIYVGLNVKLSTIK